MDGDHAAAPKVSGMPIYTYRTRPEASGCNTCRDDFEVRQSMSDDALPACPSCGSPVQRIITTVGYVRGSSMGDGLTRERLKSSGLRKLVKDDTGKYVDDTPK